MRARDYVNEQGKVRCSCQNYLNRKFQALYIVQNHLIDRGFQQSYTVWSFHGETFVDLQSNNEVSKSGNEH